MQRIILQSRHRKLLSLLCARQQTVPGHELAAQLDVTPRTIRSDVRYLNEALAGRGIRICSVQGKGYRVEMADPSSLHDLLDVGVNLQSREDRARYLTTLLALADEPYTLPELEDLLYVGRSTLENDIHYMQQEYGEKPPHLPIRQRANEIWVEDDERKRRVALSRLFVESWDSHAHSGISSWDTFLEPEDFEFIRREVIRTLTEHQFMLDDYGMMDLVFTIALAHMRVSNGHPLEEAELGATLDPRLMEIAGDLVDRLEAQWGLMFHYPEREEIAYTLQIRQNFQWKFQTRRDITRYVRPSRIQVVDRLLEEIKDLYGEDLTGDDELFVGLVRHVAPLAARIQNKYERKNFALKNIKNEYAPAMDYAVLFQKHFDDRFHYLLSEDELSFVAIYLQMAIKRAHGHSGQNKGVPTALLSHLSSSSGKLIMAQIRESFGDSLDLRGPFSTFEFEKVVSHGVRLILSTVYLDFPAPPGCRVVTIAAPPTDQQILQIRHLLRQSQVLYDLPPSPFCWSQVCSPQLFFPCLDAGTPEHVIQALAQALVRAGLVGEDFCPAVLRRERISPTGFECGLAVPHALRVPARRTALAAARLKRPIWWDRQKVEFVLLPALAAEDFSEMRRFLDLASLFSHDKAAFEALMGAEDVAGLCRELEELLGSGEG